MGPYFSGIHHVGLTVADPVQAQAFLSLSAQFAPWSAAGQIDFGADSTLLCNVNGGLLLQSATTTHDPVRRPVCEAGITHVCLQTPGIDSVHSAMFAGGGSFHCDPIDLGTGYLYCYARDPEFNVIEIEGVAAVWQDTSPWLAHVNIATANLDRLIDFYAALLGQTGVRSPRLRADPRLDAIADLPNVQLRMAWLQAGNMQIELMQYLEPATTQVTGRRVAGQPGYSHIAFEVIDLSRAVAHVQALGGRVNEGQPDAWRALCQDPDGNAIWLLDLAGAGQQSASLQALREPFINQRFQSARAALPITQ